MKPSKESKFLKKNFAFKIIPMLNPDGVVNGNTRCSLSGLDLNRCWAAPNVEESPEILGVKKVLRETVSSRDLFLFCDFHGHTRMKNLFAFGCTNVYMEKDTLKERIFPLMLHEQMDEFHFDYCKFDVQPDKESTARVNVR